MTAEVLWNHVKPVISCKSSGFFSTAGRRSMVSSYISKTKITTFFLGETVNKPFSVNVYWGVSFDVVVPGIWFTKRLPTPTAWTSTRANEMPVTMRRASILLLWLKIRGNTTITTQMAVVPQAQEAYWVQLTVPPSELGRVPLSTRTWTYEAKTKPNTSISTALKSRPRKTLITPASTIVAKTAGNTKIRHVDVSPKTRLASFPEISSNGATII